MKVTYDSIDYRVTIVATYKHYLVRHWSAENESFGIVQLDRCTKEYYDFFVNGECIESIHSGYFEYESDIIERLVFLFSEYN